MRTNAFAVFLALALPALSGTSLRATQPREWPAPVTFVDGDTNGDAKLDLSDPVYLLSYLFLGGPAPVPLECGGELSLWQNGDANGDWKVDLSDAVYLLGFLFLGGQTPVSACDNPGVMLPANSRPYGLSYGDWAVLWQQWVLRIPDLPDARNPTFDPDGALCGVDQSGPVFFLVGSYACDPITRFCAVPFGKSIFLGPLVVECSTVESPPFRCADEADCDRCTDTFLSPGDLLTFTIDGKELNDLHDFRVKSPFYEFCIPAENNILGVHGVTSGFSVVDGYWVFLAPLSKGDHTIQLMTTVAAGPAQGFCQHMTYLLTVE